MTRKSSKRNPAEQYLRNSARGGAHYVEIRRRAALHLLQLSDVPVASFHPYLANKLFKVRPEEWAALPLAEEDWGVLSRILSSKNPDIEAFYVGLVTNYVVANAERVSKLYSDSLRISSLVLQDNGPAISEILAGWDIADRQSLLAFRTLCAQAASSDETISAVVRSNMRTWWLRERFLYPLVYYYSSNTTDRYIDNFLTFVVDADKQPELELDIIKLLLKDEVATASLVVRMYLALMCHPYDACEMLVNYAESAYAKLGVIPPAVSAALCTIAEHVADRRIAYVATLHRGQPKVYIAAPSSKSLSDLLGLSEQDAAVLSDIANVAAPSPEKSGSTVPVFAALVRVRATKYPTLEDFNFLAVNANKWSFTAAGRFMAALITAYYLLPREDVTAERRHILRLEFFLGGPSPLSLSAPEGWTFSRHVQVPDYQSETNGGLRALTQGDVDAETLHALQQESVQTNRAWINAVHWDLREAEEEMRIRRWLAIVRQHIRITSNYLSGINWRWIDDVIRIFLLKPFAANPDGLYALLLRLVEERDDEGVEIRTAFEPLAAGLDLEGVVELLIREFGEEAVAFVRYFLTPDNILLLGLAPNLTAAISGRIYGIEECLRRFRFGLLMSEEQYRNEIRSLTTSLLLVNVRSGQFDVPWGIFKSQVSERHSDTYEAYASFRSVDPDKASSGRGKVVTPHQFGNGRLEKYSFEARSWPHIFLILEIVESFLEHPSFGIEAILSIRFRHDTLRREFVAKADGLRDAFILGASGDVKNEIVDFVGPPIYQLVQRWTDEAMQTKVSADDKAALFDLIPSQSDMESLLELTSSTSSFEDFIEVVVAWMRERLDRQVAAARDEFTSTLLQQIIAETAVQKSVLLLQQGLRTTDINNVVSAFESSMSLLVQGIADWFRVQGVSDGQPLKFSEVEAAALGVFETHTFSNGLKVFPLRSSFAARCIPADRVKLCFDLLVEALQNGFKHKQGDTGTVRISGTRMHGMEGVMFSSPAENTLDTFVKDVPGEPFVSLSDALFREGNSGLSKMASLAASIAGCGLSIRVTRRRKSFHVQVPLWKQQL